MKFKHFYTAIILRLAIVVILSATGGYVIAKYQMYIVGIVIFVFVIISCIGLIRYINKINKWIAFFLMGIENEDTTIKIPAKTGNKAIDDIFKGMQNLNRIFKQTKIDIINQEQYFKSVINQSATGLLSVNTKGRVVNVNPAAVSLTGLQEYHHINLLSKINIALPDFIGKVMQNKVEQTGVFENRQGQKLLFKISHLAQTNDTVTLIAVSDITKELDTREVDAWIKLSRTLSHEIMNNITPITTLSQVISGYFSDNNINEIDKQIIDNTVKGLKVIEERSVALMNFVNNYRKFTKLPEPHFEKTNISEIIENSIVVIGSYNYFDKIKVIKDIPKDVFFITDGNLLSQVIINVLKNAYEAIIENNISDGFIKTELLFAENQITIEISNNGGKISPETAEQIFTPFFTTKETGSGIGLSLSKQILMHMNGDVILRNTAGDLTSFLITLS